MEKFTKLTLEQSDRKMTWEMPYEDVGSDDLLEAFNALLIGFTWNQKTIYDAMAAYLQEHAFELYSVYEKSPDESLDEN
jgi:hypothetical protein